MPEKRTPRPLTTAILYPLILLTILQWVPQADRFEQMAELREPAGLKRYRDFLPGLMEAGHRELEAVRRRAMGFYRAGDETVPNTPTKKYLEGRE